MLLCLKYKIELQKVNNFGCYKYPIIITVTIVLGFACFLLL
jgi:hypothetical protein